MNKYFKWLWLAAFALLSAGAFGEITSGLQKATGFHQKIIFLLSENSGNSVAQERDVFIARNFYYHKRTLLEEIEQKIIAGGNGKVVYIDDLIAYISGEGLRAADVLTFIDLVDNVLSEHSARPFLTTRQVRHLRQIEQKIAIVQDTYKEDLQEMYSAMGLRGVELEPWQDYLEYLKQKYNRNTIYSEFNTEPPVLEQPVTRGASDKKSQPNLVWGYGIPDKTVVLTFDDGPHYKNTGAVLDTLKKYGVKGYFFAVGRNIGTVENNKVELSKNSKQLVRAQSEGHILANHSFTHSVLTKLSKEEQQKELAATNSLIEAVSGEKVTSFRPPYGAKNDQLVDVSKQKGMRSIMWNIDSLDWGDPIPESIVKRVMAELKTKKKGILLFHDIHKQTVQALPLLLEQLQKEGYKVVTIDGEGFAESHKKAKVEKPKVVEKSQLYGNSWALVIGINQYNYWPQLTYAVNDAKGVAQLLQEKYNFSPERVITLFDKHATREKITHYLADVLSDPSRIQENDRVFVFYAGHGMTRVLPSGRNLGYIIPVDAELDKFHSRSISMTHLQDFSEMIPAKHVYFVMDSCYSGIALTRGGGAGGSSKYLSEIASRQARQILTAGGADQEVADGGPNGHSIFTWALLDGLSGKADRDDNKIITASELGAYVSPMVSDNSSQTPAFGNLVGTEGGEFLFELSVQDIEGGEESAEQALKAELLILQKENVALKQRIAVLQQDNINAASQSRSKKPASDYSLTERKAMAKNHHEQGLKYYKLKNYTDALKALRTAMTYNPSNPTIVNDYGFVLYRNGEYQKALHWLEKTIELDAKRIPVYLNIADTLVELGREKEAVPYYRYYLALYTDSPLKERIERFLNAQE